MSATKKQRKPSATEAQRWTPEQANDWYAKLPWLFGCNYNPRTATNQLEMWQRETFDPDTIDEELGWAESIGMTSVRVFLHDLLWRQDADAYVRRIDRFLRIAKRHRIGVMFVIFDSCWNPFPFLGPQRDPEFGVHNSGWSQSPGVPALRDPELFDQLEGYVTGVISHFRDDPRVHCWDLWNEPDNPNAMSYGPRDLGDEKANAVIPLLRKTFAWARAARPTQPLTTGIWLGDWSSESTLKPHEQVQLELSDVVSFHNYNDGNHGEKVGQLKRYGRPILCTEYMARGANSTFAGALPVMREQNVGAYCWGFVRGRTQTHLPWDSWQRPYREPNDPPLWFHEIFDSDGTPYRAEEIEVICECSGVPMPSFAKGRSAARGSAKASKSSKRVGPGKFFKGKGTKPTISVGGGRRRSADTAPEFFKGEGVRKLKGSGAKKASRR